MVSMVEQFFPNHSGGYGASRAELESSALLFFNDTGQ